MKAITVQLWPGREVSIPARAVAVVVAAAVTLGGTAVASSADAAPSTPNPVFGRPR